MDDIDENIDFLSVKMTNFWSDVLKNRNFGMCSVGMILALGRVTLSRNLFGVFMLVVPTDPLFLETMIRFVGSFIPTLTIHRVFIGERSDEVLSLQIEMTDGSIMVVEAYYWLDRIQLILEYGWQRVEVWMYANFPTHKSSIPSPNSPLTMFAERDLDFDCGNEVAMDGVLSQDIDEESFEFGGETRFGDCSLGDLLSHGDLSRMQGETVCGSILADVAEESRFVFQGNALKNGTLKKSEFPKTHTGFEHSVFRPRTVDGQLEQSL